MEIEALQTLFISLGGRVWGPVKVQGISVNIVEDGDPWCAGLLFAQGRFLFNSDDLYGIMLFHVLIQDSLSDFSSKTRLLLYSVYMICILLFIILFFDAHYYVCTYKR